METIQPRIKPNSARLPVYAKQPEDLIIDQADSLLDQSPALLETDSLLADNSIVNQRRLPHLSFEDKQNIVARLNQDMDLLVESIIIDHLQLVQAEWFIDALQTDNRQLTAEIRHREQLIDNLQALRTTVQGIIYDNQNHRALIKRRWQPELQQGFETFRQQLATVEASLGATNYQAALNQHHQPLMENSQRLANQLAAYRGQEREYLSFINQTLHDLKAAIEVDKQTIADQRAQIKTLELYLKRNKRHIKRKLARVINKR